MRLRYSILSLAVLVMGVVHGQASDEKAGLHIQKCSSGVHYATKDESVDVKYAGRIYHIRILHPKVIEGPHFSTPFFWTSEGAENEYPGNLITLQTYMNALSWHSLRGYFFAEKQGVLRGFFLEDGFDNADNGSSGLIFVSEGKKSTAWRWRYDRSPYKSKGAYRIVSADQLAKPLPPYLLKTLAPVLNLAEKEADAWPGP